MAGSNDIVTKTVNEVSFRVDKGSYGRTIKKIRDVKREWEKAGDAVSKPRNDPARAYSKSADQIKMVNKRLNETRMKEEARATQHSIALAKKEARAKEQIQKQSAARIKQTMQNMTAKNPEADKMRKFYQQQERNAKKNGARTPTPLGPINYGRMHAAQAAIDARGASGNATGMVGSATTPYSPALIAKQNAAMMRGMKQQEKEKKKADNKKIIEARKSANRQTRIDDVVSQQRIRLSSKYGQGYNATLGRDGGGRGIQDLNRQFKSGAMSAGVYRQSIQALERQFRASQSAAVSFGSVLHDVRTGLVSVGAAYGVFNSGAAILKQGQFFQGLDASMLLVSQSSEEAGQRVQFVRDESYRLGLSLKEAAQGYTQMAIASKDMMSGTELNSLFSSFSEYTTAAQVDPVRYQRGIMAIQQMMGKGQVMAEELKGQLAEAVPGSLDIFVKAAQEAFGDSTIDVEKFMKMMEKGELKAKKLMPLIGKYFAEAARKGGALDKALEGNRVAMERMKQTWVNMQNAVFMGGFGDAMTKIFNDLATIMKTNEEGAKTLGHVLGQLVTGAWDAATAVYNAFVFMGRAIEYFADKAGVEGDILAKMFDWAAWAAGVGLFVMALKRVLSVLRSIAGLSGALGGIRNTLGGDMLGGPSGGKGGGPMGPNNPWGKGSKGGGSWLSRIGGTMKNGAGLFMRHPILAALGMAGGEYVLSDEAAERQGNIDAGLQSSRDSQTAIQKAVGGDMGTMLTALIGGLFGSSKPSPNIDVDKVAAAAGNPTNPFPYPITPPENPKAEVTVTIKAGELRKIIEAVVDENNIYNFNMLTGGGND